MALSSSLVKKMAFDVDCLIGKSQKVSQQLLPPVFISGLARGGTTLLLEALYSTGQFKTLTYRNMPFVTAPIFWKMLTAGQYEKSELKERAHGDRLHVGFDSPEAFEEAFWMTFVEPSYVLQDCLIPHVPDEEVLEKYRQFVSHIIAEKKGVQSLRYLAKNNNNVLRIGSIKQAFPEAEVIVPFRKPLEHAKSLLNQHKKFKRAQDEDRFTLKYMTWLGHFEFGLNFKPFNFGEDSLPKDRTEPDTLSYWLHYWNNVYQFIIQQHSGNVLFFDYDKFCSDPVTVLTKLNNKLALEDGLLVDFAKEVHHTTRYKKAADEETLLKPVLATYDQLCSLAL